MDGFKKELVIATRNKKKKDEIISNLNGLGLKFYDLDGFKQIPKVKEDGKTFKENAIKKAVQVASETGKLTLSDDSGLEVDALGGQPGIYSSRFAGQDQNDTANINKLLRLLKGVPAYKRKARFRCAVALAGPKGLIDVVEAKCEGRIAFVRKGTYGFGYDPVFIVPWHNKTFAELGKDVKMRISHRAKALRLARKIILKVCQGRPGRGL